METSFPVVGIVCLPKNWMINDGSCLLCILHNIHYMHIVARFKFIMSFFSGLFFRI